MMAQGRRIAAYLGQGHVTNTWQFGSESTYDDTALKNKINGVSETLSQVQNTVAALPTTDNDTQADWNVTDTTSPAFIANKPTIPAAMIAEYQQTTAQEIADFLDENPAAPLIIKQTNGSMLTAIYANKQSDSKVNMRCIGTIQGEYYVFDHTVDGSSWTATTYPFHDGTGTAFSGSWNDLTDKPDFSLVPQVKLVTASTDEISIPAGGRVNKQPAFDSLPDGYEIYAYRQISVERASSLIGDTANPKYDMWKNVNIQSFSITGGGTKANISMVNSGTTDALVKLTITALAMKIGV